MILITKTIKIELTDKERLIFACADGDLAEAKRLLSAGLNVNVTDQRGHLLCGSLASETKLMLSSYY